MRCADCKRTNYYTRKNKKTSTKKLELKKHCKWCRKRTTHKESKK
ncbi:MAG: 50S ribosomal protein L33 [Patescibacteria group bacterium]